MNLDAASCRLLLEQLGPSLALWRAAEVAILRRQQLEPPVLDLGCGDGIVTSMVLERVAIGVDPAEEMLACAARQGTYERLEPVRIEDLDLEPGSIGTVLSNSVLEHIEELDSVLSAAARALRPGGKLIVTVPSATFSRWLALPSARYAGRRNAALMHRNIWPASEWRSRLSQAGLEVVRIQAYLSRPLVTLWDVLELAQQVWIGPHRVVSVIWRHLPPRVLDGLAGIMEGVDLSASREGGGQLIMARKSEPGHFR